MSSGARNLNAVAMQATGSQARRQKREARAEQERVQKLEASREQRTTATAAMDSAFAESTSCEESGSVSPQNSLPVSLSPSLKSSDTKIPTEVASKNSGCAATEMGEGLEPLSCGPEGARIPGVLPSQQNSVTMPADTEAGTGRKEESPGATSFFNSELEDKPFGTFETSPPSSVGHKADPPREKSEREGESEEEKEIIVKWDIKRDDLREKFLKLSEEQQRVSLPTYNQLLVNIKENESKEIREMKEGKSNTKKSESEREIGPL